VTVGVALIRWLADAQTSQVGLFEWRRTAIRRRLNEAVLLFASLVPFQATDHAAHNVYAVDISVNVY
jgi:hypothetical protein